MQRLLYSIFISFFLILSCAKSKPSGVLSESKITEVLTEVSLVDGYLNTLPSDSAKRVMPVLYDKIFEKYDLDSATFVKNLDFYFGNPNLTDKIYTNVSSKLSSYEREIHLEDSIRNAFQQDSMNRVHYLQRVYSRTENLRYYNASDTGYKNYYEFNRRLINNSNVEFIANYLNLSPMPNLNMLHKDSLANYMRNFKSPFIHVDTAKNNKVDLTQYKLNSEKFINKLRIFIPSGYYYHAPQPTPAQVNEVILDRTSDSSEVAPVLVDSVPTVQNELPKAEQLRQQREMLRNDRMVKPVKRALPQ
ncbi:MAG TPA: DUF4296 domain-containing protein [Sphingobacterium bovisgrunnientis]|jgi:hypothetical protein|nr:DUF4296 domain-containing protein [Sphingobacterium bovisgrunnientis]